MRHPDGLKPWTPRKRKSWQTEATRSWGFSELEDNEHLLVGVSNNVSVSAFVLVGLCSTISIPLMLHRSMWLNQVALRLWKWYVMPGPSAPALVCETLIVVVVLQACSNEADNPFQTSAMLMAFVVNSTDNTLLQPEQDMVRIVWTLKCKYVCCSVLANNSVCFDHRRLSSSHVAITPTSDGERKFAYCMQWY